LQQLAQVIISSEIKLPLITQEYEYYKSDLHGKICPTNLRKISAAIFINMIIKYPLAVPTIDAKDQSSPH